MVQILMIAMEVVSTDYSRYIIEILDMEHERKKRKQLSKYFW